MSPHALSSSAALSARIQTGLQEAASRPSVRQTRCIAAPSARLPLPSPSTSSSPSSRKWRAQAWGLPNLNLNQGTQGTQGTQQQASQASAPVVAAVAAPSGPPTVSDTKAAFLKAYPIPIPAIYNTVIQELLVQQHLARYTRAYKYDPVFALGFVTVYDQLMDGYPKTDQREPIFTAYIQALQEDPAQYRADAARLEKWAAELPSATSLVEFVSRDGEIEGELKAIAARATKGSGEFQYSRFFAVGLFRLLEVAKASDPAVLQQLCEALGVSKMSVNRDLDVYRGLLSKLTQAKELMRDFLNREKAKKAERQEKGAGREKETAEAKTE